MKMLNLDENFRWHLEAFASELFINIYLSIYLSIHTIFFYSEFLILDLATATKLYIHYKNVHGLLIFY